MSVEDRIRKDITENDVVLYMKGTPQFPQCGFSGKSVQILKACGVKFKGVDVLADQEVREGVKRFSNWPTIPQLYVRGEFIGGCDIMTELYEKGELQKLVAGEKV
ncbi:MAG: Grx4 family monothiol glutaredoxin [Gammaproteobacteria bacterium]|nr:Grx4 family monothiol glutaredoxin [Gammaproteobacteria bacterium]